MEQKLSEYVKSKIDALDKNIDDCKKMLEVLDATPQIKATAQVHYDENIKRIKESSALKLILNDALNELIKEELAQQVKK